MPEIPLIKISNNFFSFICLVLNLLAYGFSAHIRNFALSIG